VAQSGPDSDAPVLINISMAIDAALHDDLADSAHARSVSGSRCSRRPSASRVAVRDRAIACLRSNGDKLAASVAGPGEKGSGRPSPAA
jgi:hypothetical protein